MSSHIFLFISILVCILSLFLILFITNKSIKQDFRGRRLAFFIAIICGILITLIRYFCLLTTKKIDFEIAYLPHVLKITLISILFCFLCFIVMNIMEKIPLNPKRNVANKHKDKWAFLLLSVLAS